MQRKLENAKGICCQHNASVMREASTVGITLVALVVTIVILLILAGITIMYTVGDNGILKAAKEAKKQTEAAIRNEQQSLGELANMLKEEYGGDSGNNNQGGNTEKPTPPDIPGVNVPIEDVINKIQNNNRIVEDENGNLITILGGFKVVPDTEDNDVDYTYSGDKKPCVQDGIVIEDREGNQFVWVPVGDIKNKDGTTTTITLGRYTFDTANGTPTLVQNADNYAAETDLKLSGYSYSFREEVSKPEHNAPAKDLGDFVNKTKADEGYYIARYEASRGADDKAKSQADKEAWKNINQLNAAIAAREMYNNNFVESDLSNSYSWDTAIVFVQNYSQDSNYANKKSVNSSELNTGKAGDKVCNIHDMASNCREWSTELSNYVNIGSRGVYRSGTYYKNDTTTTSYRNKVECSPSWYSKILSFRTVLYKK